MKKEDIGLGLLIFIVVVLVGKIITYDFTSIKHYKQTTTMEKQNEIKVEKTEPEIVEEITVKIEEVKAGIVNNEVVESITKKVEEVKEVVRKAVEKTTKNVNVKEIVQNVKNVVSNITNEKIISGTFSRQYDLVSDSSTNLMWQDDISAKNTVKSLVSGENFYKEDYNNTKGDTAEQYCENLSLNNFNDFRLPSINELKTLVNKNSKSFTYKIFKNMTQYNYWSSTNSSKSEKYATYLYTSLGYIDIHPKSYSLYVRCVRDN